jgi:hypothetical protein
LHEESAASFADLDVYSASDAAEAAEKDGASEPDEEVPEYAVERILGHSLQRRGQLRYEVAWTGGAVTWEPLENLVDYEDDGVTIKRSVLETYWEAHPELRPLQAGL